MKDHSDFFSAAVLRALKMAGQLAVLEHSPTISPRHVVNALLAGEPEGLAAAAVTRHGYETSAELFLLLEVPHQSIEALDRDVAAALRDAQRLSGDVTGEVLLAALMDRDPKLLELLKSGGLDVTAFRQEIYGKQAEPISVVEPLRIVETTEAVNTARIIDANVNRAGEAARVLEDYARFVLNDPGLSRTCKYIRHQLRDLPERLGLPALAGRNVPGDVGTAITTPSEYRRANPQDVVTANARRLQESLRSLEEYGKTLNPDAAKTIEAARYQSYTLESALASVRAGQERLADVKLYWLFTGSACRLSPEQTVREAIAGGVQMIQIREKSLSDDKLLARAKQVRKWTRELGALFIVNDRPDIARLADADGVHLGQDDLPVAAARAILGSDAIIGVSTHDVEQVRRAVGDGANYIGVGPTFPSSTKEFTEFAGLNFVRQVAEETSLPAFVLGGVTAKNLPQVIAAGGKRVAVSAAISSSENPREAACGLIP